MRQNKKVQALLITICVILVIQLPLEGSTRKSERTIDPIVATEWLNDNIEMENLVILDVRPEQNYKKGHIPGAISEPYRARKSVWVEQESDLMLEMPEKSELFENLGDLGISNDSRVVIISDPNPGEPPYYGLSGACWVAHALIWAGVNDVGILEGGYSKWKIEDLQVTTDIPNVEPVKFKGSIKENMLINQEELHSKLGKANIIDARNSDVYFGVELEPFADKPGHIPGAVSLPASWIWNKTEEGYYIYKDSRKLEKMASGVIGNSKNSKDNNDQEIITYCGVGGYGSAWWYILTQVLDFENVKLYEGSAQEWAQNYKMVPYKWECPGSKKRSKKGKNIKSQ